MATPTMECLTGQEAIEMAIKSARRRRRGGLNVGTHNELIMII